MKKVKLTIIRSKVDRELAEKYGKKDLPVCPVFKEGQVFFTDYCRPDGFCDGAWKNIEPYAFAFSHGMKTDELYYGKWMKDPDVAICCCNDALRPVVFKIEATDEDIKLDHSKVRPDIG